MAGLSVALSQDPSFYLNLWKISLQSSHLSFNWWLDSTLQQTMEGKYGDKEEDKKMTELERREIKTFIQSILPLVLHPGIMKDSLFKALFSVKC